jgi:hypothetical protein
MTSDVGDSKQQRFRTSAVTDMTLLKTKKRRDVAAATTID